MIECQHLGKTYKSGIIRKVNRMVLKDVSFSIKKGETFGLMGPSGSGKSTIGRILLGLESYTEGSIKIAGKEVKDELVTNKSNFYKNNQMIFQFPQEILNPFYTVAESFDEVRLIHNIDKSELHRKIPSILNRVGIEKSIIQRRPNQLSGGQLQRIALARILLLNPSFIVLDEPTAMLDSITTVQIIELLQQIQREDNLTYLFISHDEDLVRYISDTVVTLKEGCIVDIT